MLKKLELAQLKEEYELSYISKINNGYRSDVYSMWDYRRQHSIAVKIPNSPGDEVPADYWSNIHHSNVIPLYEIAELKDGKTAYVMPLYDTTLEKEVMSRNFQRNSLSFALAKKWIYETLCGLTEIHSQGLCHLNLRPENIVLTLGKSARLGGLSMLKKNNADATTKLMISPLYAPPEFWDKSETTGAQLDLWAFGIVTLETLLGRTFRRKLFSKSDVINRGINGYRIWNDHVRPFLKKIRHKNYFKSLLKKAHPVASLMDSEVESAWKFVHYFLRDDPSRRLKATTVFTDEFLWPFNNQELHGDGELRLSISLESLASRRLITDEIRYTRSDSKVKFSKRRQFN
ncbi:mitogen-activated protein kinase 13-like [Centruroides vittatus]|uniref:mitogen-activated protein kinase 13-like n=1 Tax=Centruroides vittatus TaxID=120091 RepID=UPI0035107923